MKKAVSFMLSAAIFTAIPFTYSICPLFDTSVSVEAASVIDPPRYAIGSGRSYIFNGKQSINIDLNWSEVNGAEQYNVYLYDFTSRKYHKVYEVRDAAWGLNTSAYLSDKDISGINNYINNNKYYFAVSAVKTVNGKMAESSPSNGYTGYIIADKEGKYIKHSEKTPVFDFKVTDITSQKMKVSNAESIKAVQAVKNSEIYITGMVYNFGKDIINNKYGSYFNADGSIEPKAEYKYNVDLNGDGRKESFIIVSMPIEYNPTPYYILVFKNSSGNMTVLDGFFSNGVAAEIYDYGSFKHFYYESMGGAGYQMHAALYGMKKDIIKTYLSGRMYPEKSGIYLNVGRHQSEGGTYYYNSRYDEYVGVTGKKVNINNVLKMDKSGSLSDMNEAISAGLSFDCYEWYGNYYIFTPSVHMGYSTVYKYENGKFSGIRSSEESSLPFLPFNDYFTAKYYTDVIE